MDHKGTVDILTTRLSLRKFVLEDAAMVYNNWANDDKVTEFLRWPAHSSLEVTESVLKDWIKSYENKDFYQWAIVLKEINEPIGSIGVVDINEKINMVEIGYCIGRKWWRQGIMSEAFLNIIPFLFDEIKVNRIEARHDPNNPGSGMVMAKCGLTFEGILRQADFSNAGIVDAAIYSLLADDYYAAK